MESTLQDNVISAQLRDKGVKIIKQELARGEEKYNCFHLDHKGVLWFDNHVVVPKNHQLRRQILDEAHLSKFSIHPESTKMYQDLRQHYWWTRMNYFSGQTVTPTYTDPIMSIPGSANISRTNEIVQYTPPEISRNLVPHTGLSPTRCSTDMCSVGKTGRDRSDRLPNLVRPVPLSRSDRL